MNFAITTAFLKSTHKRYIYPSISQFCAYAASNFIFQNVDIQMIQKANARLKFLYRKKAYLTQHTQQLLIMSLVQCRFDYACSVWYNGLTQSLKHKLQVTQNKLNMFILDLKLRDHVGHQQFESLNWLPVNKRVEQVMLCHVFKVKHKLAPSY